MAISFTPKERHGIVSALRKSAHKRAATVGMRKTTVDELVIDAGISKGAFYKFYESKEHLFLDMLEQWYQQIYDGTAKVLAAHSELAPRQGAALAMKTAWRLILEQPMMRFCRDEVPLMLRKLPENLLSEHYQSMDEIIHKFIQNSHVLLAVPEEEAFATVKILFYSLLVAPDVGEYFAQAMDSLVDGACWLMVLDESSAPQIV